MSGRRGFICMHNEAAQGGALFFCNTLGDIEICRILFLCRQRVEDRLFPLSKRYDPNGSLSGTGAHRPRWVRPFAQLSGPDRDVCGQGGGHDHPVQIGRSPST